MSLISRVKWWCAHVLERHPYSQNLVKRLLLELPILLPHHPSYWGMSHMLDHPNKLFLDVGANDGVSAMGFRRIDRSRTFRILSIEPSLRHRPMLERMKRRDDRFDFQMVAAGDQHARLELHTPVYKWAPLHTAASLSLEQAVYSMNTAMPAHVAKRCRYESQSVEVIPLDDLKLSPGIIKIDAEGFDDKVLKGLSKTITQHRPYILTEIQPQSTEGLLAFCAEQGYRLLRYEHVHNAFIDFDDVYQRNAYCVPREFADRLPRVPGSRAETKRPEIDKPAHFSDAARRRDSVSVRTAPGSVT